MRVRKYGTDFSTGAHNQTERPEFNLLVGNNEAMLTELFVAVVQTEIERRFNLTVSEASDLGSLIEHVKTHTVHLVMLILNNIDVEGGTEGDPVETRIEKVLEFVSYLKTKKKVPVVALSGYAYGVSFSEKVRRAGAYFYFDLPVKPSDLGNAVRRCLNNEDSNSSKQ